MKFKLSIVLLAVAVRLEKRGYIDKSGNMAKVSYYDADMSAEQSE